MNADDARMSKEPLFQGEIIGGPHDGRRYCCEVELTPAQREKLWTEMTFLDFDGHEYRIEFVDWHKKEVKLFWK